MIFRSSVPVPPLDVFIERFWHCSDAPSHQRERILPSGTFEFVFNLREDEIRIHDALRPGRLKRLSGAVVSGPYRSCFGIDPSQHASIVGVHFRPGGAFAFLGVRADELTDAHADLEALWGAQAIDLRERLCATASVSRRFAILENAMVSRLRNPPDCHRAVSIALATFDRTDGGARVRDVARQVGLCERHFIQAFAAEIGLTPKTYCRVRRFQRTRDVVRELDAPKPDWARIAVACGYYDQSHLIREFQKLSGLTPSRYLRQSTERGVRALPNHVAQLD
jgi:AraC-like DNA-binding protein